MSASSDLVTVELLMTKRSDVSKLALSSRTKVNDDVWYLERKARPRSIDDSKLSVDWKRYGFHPRLVAEMQRIFAIFYLAPRALGSKSGNLKPNTFCSVVCITLRFLQSVTAQMRSRRQITSLSQLSFTDLKEGAKRYGGCDHGAVRRGLRALFHPLSARFVDEAVQISLLDIRFLEFEPRDIRESPSPLYFSDEMFSILARRSIARVQDFLLRLGITIEDTPTDEVLPTTDIDQVDDFGLVFSQYVLWRRGSKRLVGGDRNLGDRLRKRGVRLSWINEYLVGVNDSAQVVLALFTGARHSELASFEVGCLREKDGVSCIAGAEFKTSPDVDIRDDTWVAIPAVRDAVHALEALAQLKNKTLLLTSTETASGIGLRGGDKSYSGGGFAGVLNRHLIRIDTAGDFQSWSFHTHQFKHSLTRQLVKAKLGLPYISYQLKHLQSRVSSLPSDVTLAYGNAAKLLQSEMAGFHFQEIKRGISRKLFDPESAIAGGGAVQFDEKRRAYFTGLMATGHTREQILDQLSATGLETFANVGLGYCTGRRRDELTGRDPPCIGSLQCNPVRCSNAVITDDHVSAWRAIQIENRQRASDPRFFYARVQFETMADEAHTVLSALGAESEQ